VKPIGAQTLLLPYGNATRVVRIVENVPAEESISGRAMRLPAMDPTEFDWSHLMKISFADHPWLRQSAYSWIIR